MTNFKSWSRNKKEFVNYQASIDEKGNKAIIFQSAADLIECCRKNFNHLGGNGNWNTQDFETNPNAKNSWRFGYDYPTVAETDKALISGSVVGKYSSRVAAVKQKLLDEHPRLKELNKVAVTKRRRKVFSEDGGELDIDRVMCGDPAYWQQARKVDVRSKIAKVYLNCNVMGDMSAETITENVIKMTAIVDIIMNAGVSLEIWAGTSAIGVHKSGAWCLIATKVKGANESLDISRILTSAIPGYFRQYMFGIRVNTAGYDERVDPGLGSSPRDVKQLKECCEFLQPDVCMNGQTFSDKKTIDLLINDIEKFFKL